MCISYRNSSDQHGDSSAKIQNPHDDEYPSEENPTKSMKDRHSNDGINADHEEIFGDGQSKVPLRDNTENDVRQWWTFRSSVVDGGQGDRCTKHASN